jgi:hypothetical protein
LSECFSSDKCPLDKNAKNNLQFLIGLRNQIEHKKAAGLDSYLSARYQACALNSNFYLKKLHGEKYGLDQNLALSLQFAELGYSQSKIIKDKESMIPEGVVSYISSFDSKLTTPEIESERFAYRLLFTKVTAKRQGQADRVIEFVDPKSDLAKNISREYWVKEETETKALRKASGEKGSRGRVPKIWNASTYALLERTRCENSEQGLRHHCRKGVVLVPALANFYHQRIDGCGGKRRGQCERVKKSPRRFSGSSFPSPLERPRHTRGT